MAQYTAQQLTSASNATYVTNTTGLIDAASVRGLNTQWVSSSALLNQANTFTGNQTITGSLTVTSNITIPNASAGAGETKVVVLDTAGTLKWRTDLSLQGTQGIQGTQGLQGTQGTQGTIGAQGISGSAGIQGFSGSQGTAGQFVQGSQGTAGSNGQSIQGVQGTIGSQGTDGGQGFQGFTGPSGSQGMASTAQGPQGITGPQGPTSQGAQGTQGIQGLEGGSGSQGYTGQSITGPQGIQGTQGTAGQSAQAVQGAQGFQGTQGIQGQTGNYGLGYAGLYTTASLTLETGTVTFSTNYPQASTAFQSGDRVRLAYQTNPSLYWEEGVITAYTGISMTVLVDLVNVSGGTYSGFNIGITGEQGEIGLQGIQGISGQAGTSGSQGVQGSVGGVGQATQGTQGATGAGTQGATGRGYTWQDIWSPSVAYVPYDTVQYQGSSYVAILSSTNVAPTNGTYWNLIAAQGKTGNQGFTGTQGSTGTGTQGATGTGVQGIQGFIGVQGSQGTTGTSGTSAQGVQGYAGSNGTNGTNGTNGSNGSQGATGPQGATGATGTGFSTISPAYSNSIIISNGTSNAAFTNSSIYVSGNTIYADAFYQNSSRALKTNITPFDQNAIDLLRKVSVVTFYYNNDLFTPHIGFIAEDTPIELSGQNQNMMDVPSVVGTLIKAVQELEERIKTLETK